MKIVAVEFNIDAKEDTIAAANAAIAIPLSPVGKNCINQGYALSAAPEDGILFTPASPREARRVGSFTIT